MRATNHKLSQVSLGLLAVSLYMWCPALAQNGPVLTVAPSAANSTNPANSPSSIKPTAPYSAQKPAVAPDLSATPSLVGALAGQNAPSAPLSQAEIWVRDRFNPGGQSAAQMLQAKKHPVKGFFKAIAKGTAQELGASAHDMAQDMVFVFSVQDIDPYDKTRAPSNKQCVVMEFTMVDGSTAYLHQFPDGSYAIENGFADGTVMVPTSPTNYIIKYPNGVNGTVVRQNDQVTVYRPDHTITTVKKEPSGNYRISNSKFGYMGEARPDDTGNQYGVGAWNYQ